MAKVNKSGPMDKCTMESGRMGKCMARGSLQNKMAGKLKANGLRERKSDFECGLQLFFINMGNVCISNRTLTPMEHGTFEYVCHQNYLKLRLKQI